jgi:hypothetical protein
MNILIEKNPIVKKDLLCSFCKKRSFSKSEGVLCSLTQAKPNFKSNCSYFEKDFNEVFQFKKKISSPKKKATIIDLANNFIHKNHSFNPDLSTTIFKSNLEVQFIIIPIILLFSSLSLNYLIKQETENWILILSQLPFALFLLIPILIGKISTKTPLFTLDKEGITFKTETFTWDFYLGFTIEKDLNSRQSRRQYIQFHFIGGYKSTLFPVYMLSISKHNLIKLLRDFVNPSNLSH